MLRGFYAEPCRTEKYGQEDKKMSARTELDGGI
jgi:hypothetical protein